MPWQPSDHHWIPQKGQWAKENPALYKATYKNLTTHLSCEEHQRVQHDEKEIGPIGSVARHDLRSWSQEFEEPLTDTDEEIDDEG